MGTTVTSLLRSGDRLVMAHIGDSRAFLLHEGELTQVTNDHTFVQRLVDEGRITREEAERHPQRSMIMRVLGDVDSDDDLDTSVREAQVGDRWLLCSDGLQRLRQPRHPGRDPVDHHRPRRLRRPADPARPAGRWRRQHHLHRRGRRATTAPHHPPRRRWSGRPRSTATGRPSLPRAPPPRAAALARPPAAETDDEALRRARRRRARSRKGCPPRARWAAAARGAGRRRLRRLGLEPAAVLRRRRRRERRDLPGSHRRPRPGRPVERARAAGPAGRHAARTATSRRCATASPPTTSPAPSASSPRCTATRRSARSRSRR